MIIFLFLNILRKGHLMRTPFDLQHVQQFVCIIKQMSKTRSKKSKNSNIPMFIAKLLQIVENQEISETVSWTSTRDCFNIKNITRFTQQILPRYFKHHNFASFIRQLNMYGFKKIRHLDGDNVYMNQHFKEASAHLLSNITRKLREEKEEEVPNYLPTQHPVDEKKYMRQISDLRAGQKKLQGYIKLFVSSNQKLSEENVSLLKKNEAENKAWEVKLEKYLQGVLAKLEARALPTNESSALALTNGGSSIAQDMRNQSANRDSPPLQHMGREQGMKRMKEIIQNACNRRFRRKQRNYIIPQEEGHADPMHGINPLSQDDSEMIGEMPMTQREEDNKSFLSINDFINAQDFQDEDFNLEESD